MIQAIVFDCFGVLTTDTWLVFVDSLPAGVDVAAVREIHRAYTAGLISKAESAAHIQKLTGRTFAEAEDVQKPQLIKNAPLLAYIRELKGRGYKIGLLSNIGSSWIRDSFLTAEEQALFDDMIFSFEVGLVKPDPRVFRLACKRLDVEPPQTVLIDDIDRYCAAARTEGMQAILYTHLKQLQRQIELLLAQKI